MSRKSFQCHRQRPRAQRGASLIEVLVSLIILMVGILGLIGLMIQSQRAQLEAYQRVQALLLVQDMATRINSNRTAADCYVQAGAIGTGQDSVALDAAACVAGDATQKDRVTRDLRDWNELLKGSAELVGTTQVGSILGARGCVTKEATTGVFQVSVVWQGNQSGGAPPAGIPCGTGLYGADEANRRAVSITVLPATIT